MPLLPFLPGRRVCQPDKAEAKKLAPVAHPPIPTAADKLRSIARVPAGFKIEVYASGVGNARSLTMGDKGTNLVGSRLLNKVSAIVEKDGKREVKVVAQGLYRPNGVTFHKGTLYIAELSQISKIDGIEDKLDHPPKPTVIYSDLRKDEAHGWKYLRAGPDDSSISRLARLATSACRTTSTLKSAASIWTAAVRKSLCAASARLSAWIGSRIPISSILARPGETGCPRTYRRTS